jgi:hypothetical protein
LGTHKEQIIFVYQFLAQIVRKVVDIEYAPALKKMMMAVQAKKRSIELSM